MYYFIIKKDCKPSHNYMSRNVIELLPSDTQKSAGAGFIKLRYLLFSATSREIRHFQGETGES